MGSVPWRESATLILVAGSKTLKTLLLERNAGGSFSKSRVFPGGVVDPSDVSLIWNDHFKSLSSSVDAVILPESAKRPPILTQRGGELRREVSLRITAIRETFEESGILLANPKKNVTAAIHELPLWRTRIMKDGRLFLEMCRELNICPDVAALKLWSNWLTPIDIPGKRFDTLFFVAEGDEAIQIDVHKSEMQNAVWISPLDAIVGLAAGSVKLAPPQMYELTRLLRFENAQELINFADARQKHGVEFTFPVRIKCSDGIVSIFPGKKNFTASLNRFTAQDLHSLTIKAMILSTHEQNDQCQGNSAIILRSLTVLKNFFGMNYRDVSVLVKSFFSCYTLHSDGSLVLNNVTV